MKYRGGIRCDIANCLMVRWGSSDLAGSLSSDCVTIKILVVIQISIFFYEMLQINVFNQGGPELHEGSATLPSPLPQRYCRRLLQVLGYQSCQEKLLPFILEEEKKERTSNNPWRKWEKIHECIGMFIEGREKKKSQKRNWENCAWFVDREDNVGNWWKNLMN